MFTCKNITHDQFDHPAPEGNELIALAPSEDRVIEDDKLEVQATFRIPHSGNNRTKQIN